MDILNEILFTHSALQAIVVISLISILGLALGKLRFWGVSFGSAFIFFVGIAAGNMGLSLDPSTLQYIESFGLAIFVYALGLQVGPGFFNSLRDDGVRLLVPAISIVLLGTALAIALSRAFGVSVADMSGILCGATTNTPALGAAQQILAKAGATDVNEAAMSCAVTYPFGIIGVIVAVIVTRKIFARPKDMPKASAEYQRNTYIASYRVTNEALFGKSISYISSHNHHLHFVISRLWREGRVTIPTSEKCLQCGDVILVTTTPHDADGVCQIFGEKEQRDWMKGEIDWNEVDSQLVSRRILVTRPEINGKKLSSLRLRNTYGININRVYRSGVELLATPDLHLQLGDRLVVVGETEAVKSVAKRLGNTVKNLDQPNLPAIFIGLIAGLILGSLPIAIPGISVPIQLGLAAGPIIVGILIGTFGPRLHMQIYTTQSANLMLRGLGLSMYLAGLGLRAGVNFIETALQPEGLMWFAMGFVVTIVPTLLVALFSLRVLKLDFGFTAGLVCGAMSNPMALNYTNSTLESNHPSLSYATVYPICMFLRVVIIQILLTLLL